MEEDLKKVIFTSLGPEKTFKGASGDEYRDGDVVELGPDDYQLAVIDSKYAQDWTEDLEIRTKRLVDSAEKTRARVLAKMSKKQKG